MDSIPYFLQLVKQNVVLYTVISTGGISDVDLSKLNHQILSETGIEFNDFILAKNEPFSNVKVLFTEEIGTVVTFSTEDSKYLENTKHYFGRDTFIKRVKGIEGSEVYSKTLKFYSHDPPLLVSLRNSSIYGNVIELVFNRNLTDDFEQYSVPQILEMYVGLCKFRKETQIERAAALSQYKLLEVLEILQERNSLKLLRGLFNDENPEVSTEAAKHFLLVNEKKAKRHLKRMAKSGEIEEAQMQSIISNWENGTSDFQYLKSK